MINLKFKDNPHLEQLSQSKKFLMISLLLAGDLSILQKKLLKNIDDQDYKKILEDLDILEKLYEFKIMKKIQIRKKIIEKRDSVKRRSDKEKN